MITIRRLLTEDAEIIAEFNSNTSESFFNQWAGKYYSFPITREQIINRIQNEANTRYFAVLLDGSVIGTVELDFIDWDKRYCSVCRFFICERFRGKGYGQRTLKLLCEHAFSELHMEKISLTVFNFNAGAFQCYKKAGFIPVSESVRPNGWVAIKMELAKHIYYKTEADT